MLRRIILVVALLWPCLAVAAVDLTEYRQATYGAPTHYCDFTLTATPGSGTGTSGDPWNYARCITEPVAGNVVGIKGLASSANGSFAAMAGPNSSNTPAFNPTHSGTVGSPIVYVTQWAAVAMDESTIGSNTLRTEFRHSGTVPTPPSTLGTGGAVLGANTHDHIIFDGFYVDMAQAYLREDSGVFTCRFTQGIQFRNFFIKGAVVNVDSNVVIYRPEECLDTVISNFRVLDYSNQPSGWVLNQQGLFSDQYGDRNFLIEKFEIRFALTTEVPAGIYLKGTGQSGNWNYGTVRYGIIRNTGACLQFNALDPSNLSDYHHIVCENQRQDAAIFFSAETINVRNLTLHHITVAKGDSTDLNYQGCISTKSSSATGIGVAVNIRDSICDSAAGSNGFEFYTHVGTPNQLDYIGHYKNASTLHWYNGTQYDSLGAWQGATVFEDNSLVVTTSPFVDRAGGNYNLSASHAWLTASSTVGELGAYEGSIDPGPDTVPDGGGGGGSSGGIRFQLFNLRR